MQPTTSREPSPVSPPYPASFHSESPEPILSPSFCETATKPINSGEKKSFIVSFVVSTILSLNPIYGLIGGTISFLASRIDSIVSPILGRHIEEAIDNTFGSASSIVKFALKLTVVLSIINLAALAIAPLIGLAIEVDLLFTTIISIGINLPALLNKDVNILGEAPEGRPYFVLFA